MRTAPFLAAALVLAALSTTAQAQPADDRTSTDLRCLIVAESLAQSDDPEMKSIGYSSLLYFYGRLEGRGQTANLATRVIEQAKTMSAADLKAQAQTCGALVTAAGQGLQSLGGDLQTQLGGGAPAPK